MSNAKKIANEKWNNNNKEVMKKSTYKSKCYKYISDYITTQEELESVFNALEQRASLQGLSLPYSAPVPPTPSNLPSKAITQTKEGNTLTRQEQRRERAYSVVTAFLEEIGKPAPATKETLSALAPLFMEKYGKSKRTTTDLFNYYSKYIALNNLTIV